MAFQDFKYVVQGILGYVEYPKESEKYDYSNAVKISEDDLGFMVNIVTELSFENGQVFICKGDIDYFIPRPEDAFLDFKYIIVELIYQSFCRQAGHIYSKYSEVPKLIPSVYNLYQKFELDDSKYGF